MGGLLAVLTGLALLPTVSFGQETNEEFQIKQEYYEQRIEDFYTRLALKEREELERNRAAKEMKQQRKEAAIQHEKARLEYIRDRERKPAPDPTLWEKENKERALAHEKARAQYVREQERFQKFRDRLPKIPPEVEYDLDTTDSGSGE